MLTGINVTKEEIAANKAKTQQNVAENKPSNSALDNNRSHSMFKRLQSANQISNKLE
jgi:hypothetical protein